MSRIRKTSSWRRPQAAGQGCREASAQPGAASLPARRREPRCAHLAHRLRHHRQPVGRKGADEDFLFQRSRAGAPLQPQHAGADLSGQCDHAAVPVQCLLSRGGRARGRQGGLQARGRRPGRQQEILDARRALRAPRRNPDHPPCVRRRLERDRQMVGRAVLRIPAARRRRYAREVRLVPLRRGLFDVDRHGDRAASPDADDASSSTAKSCRASTASR